MRKRLILVGLVIAFAAASAITPPPPLPLKERVQRASHIFVGTALTLRVVDKNGEVKPQPKTLDIGQGAEMQVRVDEVLTPGAWHPKEPVIVGFAGGFFSVQQMQKDFVGKKLIFVTTQNAAGFGPSYPWHLTEPLDKRAEIEGIIRDNPVADIQKPAAVTLARKALVAAGHADLPSGSAYQDVAATGKPWIVTFDYAPAGGGKHVIIWIDSQTGKTLKVEEGTHPR